MFENISPGEKTRKIMAGLVNSSPSLFIPAEFRNTQDLDPLAFLTWLHEQEWLHIDHFMMESLYNAVFEDMLGSLPKNKTPKKRSRTGWLSRFKFLFLFLSGTIYFGCEGFDGITAILSITALPPMMIFLTGVAFFMLSIMVFYTFGLVDIANNLDINLKTAPRIVDVYHRELELIKCLRKQLGLKLSDKSLEELQRDLNMAQLLKVRFKVLDKASISLNNILENPKLRVAKLFTEALAGVIFFSGGFFAGQTVSMAVTALFMITAAPTFLPVLLTSFVVGVMALCIYWYVERPAIEQLIGRWVGLDPAKLDKFLNRKQMRQEEKRLHALIENLEDRYRLMAENTGLKAENEAFKKHSPAPFFRPQNSSIPPAYNGEEFEFHY